MTNGRNSFVCGQNNGLAVCSRISQKLTFDHSIHIVPSSELAVCKSLTLLLCVIWTAVHSDWIVAAPIGKQLPLKKSTYLGRGGSLLETSQYVEFTVVLNSLNFHQDKFLTDLKKMCFGVTNDNATDFCW